MAVGNPLASQSTLLYTPKPPALSPERMIVSASLMPARMKPTDAWVSSTTAYTDTQRRGREEEKENQDRVGISSSSSGSSSSRIIHAQSNIYAYTGHGKV